MKEQGKNDMKYLDTLREKRRLLEERQQMRLENFQKTRDLNEKNLKGQIEKLQNSNHIFEKRNSLFLEEIDSISKKYQNKFVEVLASGNHLKEMKQLFYASLCDSYPNLAKDLRYALFQQKKELDERLEYILENAKSIQEKQEEIYKLKSEIVQRTGHLAKNQSHQEILKEKPQNQLEDQHHNYESEQRKPVYHDFDTFQKSSGDRNKEHIVPSLPLYKPSEYDSYEKPSVKSNSNHSNKEKIPVRPFQETKKKNDYESENYETKHLRQRSQEETNNFVQEHEHEEEFEDQYQHHQNPNQFQHHQNQYENEEEPHGNIYVHEENQNLETPTYEHEKKPYHGNQFSEEQFNDRGFNEKNLNFNENHKKNKFMENNEDPPFSENNYEENQINEGDYPREFNEEDNVENNYDDDFEHSSINKREEEKENIIQSHHSNAGEKKNLVGLMTTSSEFTSDRNNFGDFQKNRDPSFGAKSYLKFTPPTGQKKFDDPPPRRNNPNEYQPEPDEFEDI